MGNILFSTTIKGKDCYYHFAKEINAIFTSEKLYGELKYLTSLPEEQMIENYLSSSMVLFEDKLVVAPMKANKIWIYEILNDEWKGINCFDTDAECKSKIGDVIVYEKNVVLLGYRLPYIVVLDMENYNVKKIRLDEGNIDCSEGYIFRNVELIENKLYSSCISANRIYVVDLETETIQTMVVGEDDEKFIGLVRIDENLWVAPYGGNRVLGLKTEKTKDIIEIKEKKLNDNIFFNGIWSVDKSVFLTSSSGELFYFLTDNDNDLHKLNAKVEYAFRHDNDIAFHLKDGRFAVIDNGKLIMLDEFEKNEEVQEFISHCCNTRDMFAESATIGLNEFINSL